MMDDFHPSKPYGIRIIGLQPSPSFAQTVRGDRWKIRVDLVRGLENRETLHKMWESSLRDPILPTFTENSDVLPEETEAGRSSIRIFWARRVGIEFDPAGVHRICFFIRFALLNGATPQCIVKAAPVGVSALAVSQSEDFPGRNVVVKMKTISESGEEEEDAGDLEIQLFNVSHNFQPIEELEEFSSFGILWRRAAEFCTRPTDAMKSRMNPLLRLSSPFDYESLRENSEDCLVSKKSGNHRSVVLRSPKRRSTAEVRDLAMSRDYCSKWLEFGGEIHPFRAFVSMSARRSFLEPGLKLAIASVIGVVLLFCLFIVFLGIYLGVIPLTDPTSFPLSTTQIAVVAAMSSMMPVSVVVGIVVAILSILAICGCRRRRIIDFEKGQILNICGYFGVNSWTMTKCECFCSKRVIPFSRIQNVVWKETFWSYGWPSYEPNYPYSGHENVSYSIGIDVRRGRSPVEFVKLLDSGPSADDPASVAEEMNGLFFENQGVVRYSHFEWRRDPYTINYDS